jgi:hypothetical protein
VSGGFAAPVSPAPVRGPGNGPVARPVPGPPPRAGSGAPVRRVNPATLVVGAVALVVVLVAAVGGLLLFSHETNKGKGGTTASGSSGPLGHTAKADPGKYPITRVPEDLCAIVQVGHLGTTFATPYADGPPAGTRNLNTFVGTGTCTVQRQQGSGAAIKAVATLTLTMMIFSDVASAASTQKTLADSARLNDPGTVAVTGVGDEAVVSKTASGVNKPDGTQIASTEEVRASNLRWTVSLIETRIDPAGPWSDADRKQLVADLEEAVRATHARFTAS